MTWPDIFINGKVDYELTIREAAALAYTGWCCYYASLGKEIPEKFGEGMVFLGKVLGYPPLENNLKKDDRLR